jgi:hypothetical protein
MEDELNQDFNSNFNTKKGQKPNLSSKSRVKNPKFNKKTENEEDIKIEVKEQPKETKKEEPQIKPTPPPVQQSQTNMLNNEKENIEGNEGGITSLLQSKKFQDRVDAYEKISKWEDSSYTKKDFVKELPQLLKEKHMLVIEGLLKALDTVIDSNEFKENIDFESFLNNFIEEILSNAKGKSASSANDFIDIIWDCWDDKSQIISILNKNLGGKKPKTQEKSLYFISELIKNGNIEEMKGIKNFEKDLIELSKSRTAGIRKNVISIYKEAYVWLGSKFVPEIEKLAAPQVKEIKTFITELTEADMKVGQKKQKKIRNESKPEPKQEAKKETNIEKDEIKIDQKNSLKKSLRESRFDLKDNIKENLNNMVADNIFNDLQDINIEEIKNFDSIDKIRNHLKDENILKITDTKVLEKLVDIHLQNVFNLTEEFSKIKKVQLKQIYMIIEEISEKLPIFQLSPFSRKIIASFYLEQILNNYNEDILNSMNIYVKEKNQKMTKKTLVYDLLEIFSKNKSKPNKEFVSIIAILLEMEIISSKSLSAIPHKELIDFIKNFIINSGAKELKDRIFNLMRNISQIFGKNCLDSYPSNFLKEFEIQNKEIEKDFNKLMDKLREKKSKERYMAILELVDIIDASMLQMLWSSDEFLKFIKRSLITETKIDFYKKIVQIILNYLQFHKTSPADFSLKSYLYIFHTIITQYYDLEGNENERNTKPERFEILQEIFTKTIHELKPTIIFNQMIGDMNSQNWKEQILGFYLQYGNLIDVQIEFVEYIIEIANSKENDNEIRNLINKVLIQLKNCEDDLILERGNENKFIREIWQRNEEDILFADDFLSFEKIFKDKGFYESIKNFIIRALEMNEKTFYSLKIDSIIIDNSFDSQNKAKIAYLYLRSNENLPSTAEHILMQIRNISLMDVDSVTILIIIRILLNLLKNNFFAQGDVFYQDVFEYFSELIQNLQFTPENLIQTLQLQSYEIKLVNLALMKLDEPQETNQDYLNVTMSVLNKTVNEPGGYEPYGLDDQSRLGYTNTKNNYNLTNFKDNGRISRVSKNNLNYQQNENPFNKDPGMSVNSYNQENPFNKDNGTSVHSYKSHLSRTSLVKKNKSDQLENPQLLKEQFDNMLSFEIDHFKLANDYFIACCESKNPETSNFLAAHANNIIRCFTNVLIKVFENGIEYSLDLESYNLIFDPLKKLTTHKALMDSVTEDVLNPFVEEILKRLVLSNEEKSQLEKEPQSKAELELASEIVKNFNGIMLKVINQANVNLILTSFFIILLQPNPGLSPKINNSIIQLTLRCILRISNNLKNKISEVDPCTIFTLVFNYQQIIEMDKNNNENKIIKKLLRELITHSDQDYIIDCYNQVFEFQPETNIKQIIQILHHNMNKSVNENNYSEAQKNILALIEDLNNEANLSKNKTKLNNYFYQIFDILKEEPDIDFRNFKGYFKNKKYYEFFMKHLANKISRYQKNEDD